MIDRLLFADGGRGARVVVLVLLLAALGVLADRVIGPREPAIADLLAAPDAHDGERVFFITHPSADVRPDGLTVVDQSHRLAVVAPIAGIAEGEAVSVEGIFHARGADDAPWVDGVRVVGHPRREVKKWVSGAVLILLVVWAATQLRVRGGAIEPRTG